jgi:hypothetical protein
MPANIPMMPEDELPTEDLSTIWERMIRQQQQASSQPASRRPSYDPWSDALLSGSPIRPKPIQYPIGAKSELKWQVYVSHSSGTCTLKLGKYGYDTREQAIASQLASYKGERANCFREINALLTQASASSKMITAIETLASELAKEAEVTQELAASELASQASNNASLPNA